MECKKTENKKTCTCPSESCDNHGVCCDCIKAHFARKSLPMCMRDLDWLEVKT
jgi:hypothetical protein